MLLLTSRTSSSRTTRSGASRTPVTASRSAARPARPTPLNVLVQNNTFMTGNSGGHQLRPGQEGRHVPQQPARGRRRGAPVATIWRTTTTCSARAAAAPIRTCSPSFLDTAHSNGNIDLSIATHAPRTRPDGQRRTDERHTRRRTPPRHRHRRRRRRSRALEPGSEPSQVVLGAPGMLPCLLDRCRQTRHLAEPLILHACGRPNASASSDARRPCCSSPLGGRLLLGGPRRRPARRRPHSESHRPGSDSSCARGRPSRPCATLLRAYQLAACGDVVAIDAGSYGDATIGHTDSRQNTDGKNCSRSSKPVVFRGPARTYGSVRESPTVGEPWVTVTTSG